MTTYREVSESLKDLPMTWYPGLIKELIKEAYKKNVFLPGGAGVFVEGVEEKIERC